MKKLAFTWDRGVGLFLIFTIIVGSFITPYFAVSSNISFVIQDIGEIAIIALPMAFLIIAGEIDLSVASTLALSSAAIGYSFRHGVPFSICVLIGLIVGLACGIINGILVTKFGLQSLAVTIGTLALFRGLCYVLLGNEPVNQMPESWVKLGYTNIPHTFLPYSVILIVLFGAAAWIILHYTRFGRWTFALGINADAAKFSGIPVERIKLTLFAMTGLMSGVAGVVYTFRFASASPNGATGFELAVIASVLFGGVSIAGGVGTMWGVLAAVLGLGVIRSVLQLIDVSANALLIVSGGLLLISVVLPRAIEISRSRRKITS
jgi:rhamnose transport system permease protein